MNFRFARHLHRLRRHYPDGDGAGGGWRRRSEEDAPLVAGEESPVNGSRAEELEIEKKWFLLVRTDPERFELFYEKYRRPLLSFIQHRVGDPDTAEDLVSETFLEAVNGLWRFRFQGVTFGAWLYRLARRRIAKHYERRQRRQETTFAGNEHDAEVPPAIETGLEEGQDHQLLALAVRQLDPLSQDVVILHYWEGLTLAQIAAILGTSEDSSKTRLHRARRKLASLLEAPEIRSRLSREGRRALDELRMDLGRMRLIDGGDERGES